MRPAIMACVEDRPISILEIKRSLLDKSGQAYPILLDNSNVQQVAWIS